MRRVIPNIPKQILVEMYSEQKMRMTDIADHFGVCNSTIARALFSYGIPVNDRRYFWNIYKTRDQALKVMKKAFKEIGEPFTIDRFNTYIGEKNHAQNAISSKYGWISMLERLGIPPAPRAVCRSPKEAAVTPIPSRSLSYKEDDPSRDAKLINCDRSTAAGFKKYMRAYPYEYESLSRRRFTEENLELTVRQYEDMGLIGASGAIRRGRKPKPIEPQFLAAAAGGRP